jgi:hypothetical protein
MSDIVALDLFIQDFVNTNKLLNRQICWRELVSRRLMEGAGMRVLSFQSGGDTHYATAQYLMLPDGDCLRISLTRAIPDVEEHRFDCLTMLSAQSHTGLRVEKYTGPTVVVRLTTRHMGLLNVAFVIQNGLPLENPVLVR